MGLGRDLYKMLAEEFGLSGYRHNTFSHPWSAIQTADAENATAIVDTIRLLLGECSGAPRSYRKCRCTQEPRRTEILYFAGFCDKHWKIIHDEWDLEYE